MGEKRLIGEHSRMVSGKQTTAPRGTVLYDGACGFCRWWIPFWAPALSKRGFEVAELQEAWVRRALNDDKSELLVDLRLLLPDGRQIRGADVYRYVTRRIWWAYPVYLASIAPLASGIFDASYRGFARIRYRFSSACGLKDPKLAERGPQYRA